MQKIDEPVADAVAPATTHMRFEDQAARDVLRQFRLLLGTIKRHYRDVEAQCGVGGAQLWALAEVAAAPGLTVRDLASAMLIHQSTASNLVDRLVKLGLVTKQRGEADRRQTQLSITHFGRQVLARAPEPAIGVLQGALQSLPTDAIRGLEHYLQLLIDELSFKDSTSSDTPLANL